MVTTVNTREQITFHCAYLHHTNGCNPLNKFLGIGGAQDSEVGTVIRRIGLGKIIDIPRERKRKEKKPLSLSVIEVLCSLQRTPNTTQMNSL